MSKTNINIQIPESLDNGIKNLTNKPTANMGQILSDLLTVLGSRVRQFALKHSLYNSASAELFNQEIQSRITMIQDNKLRFPESQILYQAIEDSIYCVEYDELRSMFASLIANACNLDYSKLMHPSFSSTLKRMSPYDAALFKKLVLNTDEKTWAAEYSVVTNNSAEYTRLYECIPFFDGIFKDFEMQALSISALKQLGLIDYFGSEPICAMEIFEKNEYFQSLKEKYSGTNSYPLARSVKLYVTPYGNAFAEACSIKEIS